MTKFVNFGEGPQPVKELVPVRIGGKSGLLPVDPCTLAPVLERVEAHPEKVVLYGRRSDRAVCVEFARPVKVWSSPNPLPEAAELVHVVQGAGSYSFRVFDLELLEQLAELDA